MKKIYSKEIVEAEQFTDDYTPDGVLLADEGFIKKVLAKSLYESRGDKVFYLFKLPKPNDVNKDIALLFGVPYPFEWIEKGDYVLTYSNGYACVEKKQYFEHHYKQINMP